MSKSQIISRDLSPKDCSQLPYLLEKVWGRKTEEDYWRWKFLEYPFERNAIVFENQAGDIVGLNAFWIRPTKMGQGTYFPWLSIDTMADPKYRGAGIAQDIIAMFISQLSNGGTIFGFTNAISNNMFSKYLEKDIIIECNIPIMVAAISPGFYTNTANIIKTLINKISKCVFRVILFLKSCRNISVKRCDEIGDDFDRLWEDVSRDYYWIQNRSRDYLQWRYLNAPHRDYQVWSAFEDEKLVGYLVTTIKKDSKKVRGFIVDWLVSRDRPDIFKAMVTSALDWLIDQKADVVEVLLMNHEKVFRKILKTHLFYKIKRTQSFLLASTHRLKQEDMFLTMGDSDQI